MAFGYTKRVIKMLAVKEILDEEFVQKMRGKGGSQQMGKWGFQISADSVKVLEMIAGGSTYDQILAAHPDLTYLDIFRGAQEALDALAKNDQKSVDRLDVIRRSYPRAYEKWSAKEEVQLRDYIHAGLTVAQIAGRLQRQRSAIRSRIVRLNWVEELNPKEQARLIRISKLDTREADPSDP